MEKREEMPVVYVCSPLRGDIKRNIENAKKYCRSVYEQGGIPIAPHLLFTQFLDDENEKERENAMKMDIELLHRCDEMWVFAENGISIGMAHEIEAAGREGMEVRYIGEKVSESKSGN